jgi:hypothetical protein
MSNVCQIFITATLDTLDTMVYTFNIHGANIERIMDAIMARAFTKKTRAEQFGNPTVSSTSKHESTCARCGGLMVTDFCMDLLFCIGETEFPAKRCVQCGEIVDPVILRNRGAKQEPVTAQPAGKLVPNNHVTNGCGGFSLQTYGTGFRHARGLESQTQQK